MPTQSYVLVQTIDEFKFLWDEYLVGKNFIGKYSFDPAYFLNNPHFFPMYIIRTTNGYKLLRYYKSKAFPNKYKKYLDYTNYYKIQIALDA